MTLFNHFHLQKNYKIVGLETEKDYKYDGEDEKCHFEKSKVKATIKGGISIPKVNTFIL